MLWYQKFYLQDLIDAWRPSIPEIKNELKAKAEAFITWNYGCTEQVCSKLPGGLLTMEQALAAAGRLRYAVAYKSNRSAIQALYPLYSSINANFYPLEKERFRLGMTPSGEMLFCKIKMLGLLHDGINGNLYWNNYRLHWPTDDETRQIIASVASMSYLDDPEYESFGLRLVDVSSLDGAERNLRSYDAGQINLLGATELAEFFEPVTRALIELIKEGYQPVKTKREKSAPAPDLDQPDLFG